MEVGADVPLDELVGDGRSEASTRTRSSAKMPVLRAEMVVLIMLAVKGTAVGVTRIEVGEHEGTEYVVGLQKS